MTRLRLNMLGRTADAWIVMTRSRGPRSARRPRRLVRRLLVTLGVVVVVAGTGLLAAQAGTDPVGIDVASYQHPDGVAVNWPAVAAGGLKFVFSKATQGTNYTNPYFASDRDAASAAGIAVGAYDFADPTDNPVTEADYFLSVVGTGHINDQLPDVLDLEVTEGLTPSQITAWAMTWLSTVRSATGRTPIIYSYYYFFLDDMSLNSALASYPLWLADYDGASTPPVPAPWGTWTFWQYTDAGAVPGIAGNVDHSLFNGSLAQLASLEATGTTYLPPAMRPVVSVLASPGSIRSRVPLAAASSPAVQRTTVQVAPTAPAATPAPAPPLPSAAPSVPAPSVPASAAPSPSRRALVQVW